MRQPDLDPVPRLDLYSFEPSVAEEVPEEAGDRARTALTPDPLAGCPETRWTQFGSFAHQPDPAILGRSPPAIAPANSRIGFGVSYAIQNVLYRRRANHLQ